MDRKLVFCRATAPPGRAGNSAETADDRPETVLTGSFGSPLFRKARSS